MASANYDEAEDLGIIRRHFWLDDPPEGFVFKLRNSDACWKLGRILTERVLHGDEYGSIKISEASGMCIATQIEGPRKGMQAMMRIRMQIPPWLDDPDEFNPHCDYSQSKSPVISYWANNELVALQYLTKQGCKSVPRLLGYSVRQQSEDAYVSKGYIAYILMEKVPGRNLIDFPTFPLEKRDRVRIAFAKALRDFYSYSVNHDDPHRRNVVWDEDTDQCFIVDMEDVDRLEKPKAFVPLRDWANWGLARPKMNDGPLDPMLPDTYDECPDDNALYALVARSANHP